MKLDPNGLPIPRERPEGPSHLDLLGTFVKLARSLHCVRGFHPTVLRYDNFQLNTIPEKILEAKSKFLGISMDR
jgi:hypothetical protein